MATTGWTDPPQIPSSAYPASLYPLPASAFRSTSHPGFAGASTAPITYRTSTRNLAIKQTVQAFVNDAPERLWWTVKDVVVEGDGPWWRLVRARNARRASERGAGKEEKEVFRRALAGSDGSTTGSSSATASSAGAAAPPLTALAHADSALISKASIKKHLRRMSLPPLPPRFPGFTAALHPSTSVIMLGGFRGSVLETDPDVRGEGVDGKPVKVWPNMARAMFNPGEPDLATLLAQFPPTEGSSFSEISDEEQRRHDEAGPPRTLPFPAPMSSENDANQDPANGIRATHMANTIGGLVNMGWSLRRRLERLERDGNIASVVRWGYDFRIPLRVSSARLIEEVTRLRREASERRRAKDSAGEEGREEGVTVFAHSMGGLVTLHALATCPDPSVFGKIIFFGVPWRGCAGIMGPLRRGDGFLRQRAVCDAVTSSSWPASFHLLPDEPPFYDPSGAVIPVDLFNIDNWDVYGLSPLASGLASRNDNEQAKDAGEPRSPDVEEARMRRESAQLQHAEEAAQERSRRPRLSISRPNATFPTAPEMGEPPSSPRSRSVSLRVSRSRSRSASRGLRKEVSTDEPQQRRKSRPLSWLSALSHQSNAASQAASSDPSDEPTFDSTRRHSLSRDFEADPHHYRLHRAKNDAALAYMRARSPLHPVNASPSTVRAHFERCLAEVEAFRRDILSLYDEGKKYPPMVVLAGRSQPTIKGAVISEPTPEKVAEEGHERLVFDHGDGVVTWESALSVPGGWGREVVKVIETRYGHLAMMSDTQAINDALLALEGASIARARQSKPSAE